MLNRYNTSSSSASFLDTSAGISSHHEHHEYFKTVFSEQ